MDRLVGRHHAVDGIEEADEFLMGMALHATAEDDAIERVEGGKQGGRAVALVVMRHGPALAGLERQTRLGAIERLDLGFLVDRQHHGMGRRVHIEADNVLDLFSKGGVCGALEGAYAVRLQAVLFPDPLDRAQRQANRLGHRPAGPMGGLARRLGAGQRQHLGHGGGCDRRFARRPGLVAQQTFHPGLGIAALPAPHRRTADPGAPRHLDDRQPIRREQDNPGPLQMLQRPAPIADDRGQPRTILSSNDNANFLCHTPTIAQLTC